jgi:YggT family protein
MDLLAYLLNISIQVYIYIIIAQVAVSWLMVFDIINANNEKAQNLVNLLQKATDPVYKPLRKYIPPIGGIDITPLIVIIGLSVIGQVVVGALYSL